MKSTQKNSKNNKCTCNIQIFAKSSYGKKTFYSPLGGSIDVGLLGENHHKIRVNGGNNCNCPKVMKFLVT